MNGFKELFQLRASGEGAGAVQGGDYVAVFMLGLLLLILCVGALFVWMATRHSRERRAWAEAELLRRSNSRLAENNKFRPEYFESPCRWIAVRSTEPRAVQKALKLVNPTLCTWAEGMAEARDRRIFITPPIGEWVLVVGPGLPDPGDDVDKCFLLLTDLSRKLGLVQFFSLNRAVGHHAWARLDCGEVLRAYAWAGHVAWNQGPASPAELGLGLNCFEYHEQPEGRWGSGPDPLLQNLERLPMLAARWSVDPAALDERHFLSSNGIVGELT
ncbi:MAG: hypothetical protein FJ392_05410 [Verrucomicrobia bacterium]|nr:hypothetical protein [Verrucomicrobiota bacterium]